MTRHASAAERHRAVREVLDGRPVGEVARRHGVSRQTLHAWRQRYAAHGEGGLRDRSRRPHRSPARIAPAVEALICSLREQHPDWGAGRLRAALVDLGIAAPPSRSTVHRVLVRNRLLGAGEDAGAGAAGRVPGAGAGAAAPGAIGGLIAAARDALDRLGSALAGLEGGSPSGAEGRPGGAAEGGSPSGAEGGAEGCPLCVPPVRLFARPPSTISRYGTVIPRPREVPLAERSLTESARCRPTD
ncbi:helix-turn-helix domain-containing protein [Streptomyces sp. NPDC015232]|uniref:helix-turn-helix domain-containing protein n=1 Tax=unclassified Streptomyces TaxID=2593676 RepID=UPI0036F81930